MKFKDLENAVIGETILINGKGLERIFMGFTPNSRGIFTITNDSFQKASGWAEHEIKDWKIKQPEREIIQLYDSIDGYGFYRLCDKSGRKVNFIDGELCFICGTLKQNIIKPSYKIYADTFEIVKE